MYETSYNAGSHWFLDPMHICISLSMAYICYFFLKTPRDRDPLPRQSVTPARLPKALPEG